MNEDICYSDAVALAERIRLKDISPVEVVRAHLARIEAINPKLNAIVAFPEGALDRAREAEAAISRGESWGPLHGVPFTVKDCVDTEGVRTTRGSKLFSNYVPTADATVVKRLKDSGGIFIAKTNMPEFALWWETSNLVYGRTENPWMHGRTPGGSSGGEAAAIASGLSPMGVGSDVGGSIREPAHYCGIVGLKATHGRIPLTGHWPDTLLRFMHVGPLARSVRDAAAALLIMEGADGVDSYAHRVQSTDVPDLTSPLPALRVAWCTEGPFAPVDPEVAQTVAMAATTLEELGCAVEPVSLGSQDQWSAQAISMMIYGAEGGHFLEPLITGREDQLAPSMQWRLALPPPAFKDYTEAVEQCERLRAEIAAIFGRYDLLLCPTGPVPAPPHDSYELEVAGQKVSGRHALAGTMPFDLTGSPAISVPFGFSSEGLPIGVQLVGRHFDEATVLHAAAKLEDLQPLHQRPPV
jgi:aspartyl-tRNA(Asn)/glutamyl-tRNA(Gln) amidotransferase subunit A